MAGDPDLQTSALMLEAISEAGADAIELGIPYGDPLADGPTIAAAGTRALQSGVSIAQVLELVRNATARGAPPILLFTYFNPVYQYGIEQFADDAAKAGAAGAIVPDVALEEGEALREALLRHGLCMPLLVAPSTGRERAARIAGAATGFVYVVSRLGVTGAGSAPDFSPLRARAGNAARRNRKTARRRLRHKQAGARPRNPRHRRRRHRGKRAHRGVCRVAG